jgi:hypothetical protein
MRRVLCACIAVRFKQEFLVGWRGRCGRVTEGVVGVLLLVLVFLNHLRLIILSFCNLHANTGLGFVSLPSRAITPPV